MSEMFSKKNINKLVIICFGIIVIIIFFFILRLQTNSGSDNYTVMSSIYVIDQYVKALTDNNISTEVLIPVNVDPH